jgi:alcohol dehydrogenase YqhD (iron-dependent ADH family)
MKDFEFYNPVKIIFGVGKFACLGAESAKYGKKVLLVKSAGPLEKLGVYAKAKQSLESAGMEVHALENVAANPKLSSVREGIKICKDRKIDVIVAVGGGSPIDCAKAIGVGAVHDADIWDFFTGKKSAEKSLPVGAVSTLAATGAEMSLHCVITNEELKQKYASHFAVNYPKFAIIDPQLHLSVPHFLTAAGMCDTITHSAENYFAGDRLNPMTDRIAEGIVLTVIESEKVLDQLDNLELRSNLAWAATLSINGLTDCGRGAFEYGAHIIEHNIAAHYDVTHGAGLSVVHPAWLSRLCEKDPSRFAHFAERIFGMKKGAKTDMELGMAGIAALKEKYKSWGLPVTMKELGVKDESKYDDIASSILKDPDSFIKDKNIVFDVLARCK